MNSFQANIQMYAILQISTLHNLHFLANSLEFSEVLFNLLASLLH